MIKINLNKYIGAAMVGLALVAIPSCTDKWDEHYEPASNDGTNATKTLWEQICETPELSNFRTIAEKASYYRDDTHPVKGFTYADILKSNRTLTVWAPENNSMSENEWKEWEDMCESKGYEVHSQLMANHIALYRYQLIGDDTQDLKTINGKNATFDKKKEQFQNIDIIKKNIPAKNGMLHIIKERVPFQYSLYEFIKYGGKTPEATKFIIARDTTYFITDGSIEGFTNEDGNPEYVDSVYRTSNRLLGSDEYWPTSASELKKWIMPEKGFGRTAQLRAEDSTFIMVLPNSSAITAAKAKLDKYYNYAPMIWDESTYNSEVATASKRYNDDDKFTFTPEQLDSLKEMSMMMDILTPTVFNIHNQVDKSGKVMTMEQFLQKTESQYYLNTRGDTLRSTETWNNQSLFPGTPLDMSNGKAFVVDSWNFPLDFYKPDIYVEVNGAGNLFDTRNTIDNTGHMEYHLFTNNNFRNLTKMKGVVSKDGYVSIKSFDKTDKNEIYIPLYTNTAESYNKNGEVMSGKYDIQVVFVPAWYDEISDLGTDENFVHAKVDSLGHVVVDSLGNVVYEFNQERAESLTETNKFQFTVYANMGKGQAQKHTTYTLNDVRITKVDTVTIGTVDFNYTYKNIRSYNNRGRKTFPYLSIKTNCSASEVKSKGYSNDYRIDRIILKSKE